MITNATITRIDVPVGVTARGQRKLTEGDTIAVRCFLGTPTKEQRVELGAIIADSTALVCVQNPPVAIENGGVLVVQSDEETDSRELEIQHIKHPVKAGGLSHFKVFLRSVRTS